MLEGAFKVGFTVGTNNCSIIEDIVLPVSVVPVIIPPNVIDAGDLYGGLYTTIPDDVDGINLISVPSKVNTLPTRSLPFALIIIVLPLPFASVKPVVVSIRV